MWMTIGAAVLIAWLVVAVGIIVVTFARRVRARGFPEPLEPDILPYTHGRYAPTPLPQWAKPDGDPDEN